MTTTEGIAVRTHDEMICTVTPTVMAGAVVRWYFPNDSQAGNPAVEPALSASRNGVRIGTFLHEVEGNLLDHAVAIHRVLAEGGEGAVKQAHALATHRREGRGRWRLIAISDQDKPAARPNAIEGGDAR